MAKTWTCRKCRKPGIPRVKRLCPDCRAKAPKRQRPKHMAALDVPYEEWVDRFGEVCGVCGREPGPNRRLDRDHCHRTGEPRGLLCHRCNRALASWLTAEWLTKAAAYLDRSG